MTLQDIVARLERIAAMPALVTSVHSDEDEDDVTTDTDATALHDAVNELKLDIERHILRTEGTLTP